MIEFFHNTVYVAQNSSWAIALSERNMCSLHAESRSYVAIAPALTASIFPTRAV
ncbi:hypothetical protein [Microcoleus sp. CAWBG58]|uniref:hypothetical protein n=1 Tax=Microcoleus sp. CAWBG58 TaxID=2841651 RepID=UPI0025D677E3|nr:hypothetical protein [Microcoleus sp. CAWBG58]